MLHYTLTLDRKDANGDYVGGPYTQHFNDFDDLTDMIVESAETWPGLSPEFKQQLNRAVTQILGKLYAKVWKEGHCEQEIAAVAEEGCVKITVKRETDVALALTSVG